MGAQDPQKPTQDFVHLEHGIHDTLADATPEFRKVGGKHVAQPASGTSGNALIWWLDNRGYATPHLDIILLDSQTTISGSGTGTTTGGLGAFKEMDVLLDITVAGGGTSTADRTLAVFLDSRLDGTTYFNIGAFSGTGSVVTKVVHLSKSYSTITADLNITADAGTGTFRSMGWGNELRVRRTATGTSPSFSYRVWIVNAV